jgi:DNA-binding NtrC family response regulator
MPLEASLLIVEDDQELLNTFARWFIRRGYAVTAVRHPRQALGASSVRSYDVAVLDYTLPEQSGIELMKNLRRRIAGLQVILLSGQADPLYENEAIASGAFAFFCKPCALSELEAAIERALEERIVAGEEKGVSTDKETKVGFKQ